MKKVSGVLCGILILALSALMLPAAAQDNYPASTIRMVVGFAPGASSDLVARLLAQKLSAQMNTNVIVENRDGAGSHIAAELVANAKPDGYIMLLITPAQVLGPAFGEKLNYDVFRDLASVAVFAYSPPTVLYVSPSVPANTPAEFVAYLRANPDKVAYGTSGVGSIPHLNNLLFLQSTGLTALHVPYKGGAQILSDVMAGRIQYAMSSVSLVGQMVKEKRVKALAIADLKRTPLLPDVPTLSETILPGFGVNSWYGMMVPAKTPPAIVKRINAEIVRALRDAEMKSRLAQEGIDPTETDPERATAFVKSEYERWSKVIKSAGLKRE